MWYRPTDARWSFGVVFFQRRFYNTQDGGSDVRWLFFWCRFSVPLNVDLTGCGIGLQTLVGLLVSFFPTSVL